MRALVARRTAVWSVFITTISRRSGPKWKRFYTCLCRSRIDLVGPVSMRRCSVREIGLVTGIFLILVMAFASATVMTQEQPFPLEPPDTTSPKGSLLNLNDNVVAAHR